MTTVLLLSFVVMLVSVAGMAIGAMVSGRRLRGSCGGIGPGGKSDCLCDAQGRPRRCEAPEAAEPPLAQLPGTSK